VWRGGVPVRFLRAVATVQSRSEGFHPSDEQRYAFEQSGGGDSVHVEELAEFGCGSRVDTHTAQACIAIAYALHVLNAVRTAGDRDPDRCLVSHFGTCSGCGERKPILQGDASASCVATRRR
jgi:hypothetical protein